MNSKYLRWAFHGKSPLAPFRKTSPQQRSRNARALNRQLIQCPHCSLYFRGAGGIRHTKTCKARPAA